jgi:DNA polymerase-3 subunit epsilon
VAIDVETANPDMASICQVGVAGFEGGQVDREWCTYVDPEDWFDPYNIAIHGIDEDTVAGAPTLPEVVIPLLNQLQGTVVVCHTHFDRVSLQQAFAAHGLELPTLTWLDSARVARRAWEQCRYRGYGLADVCSIIDYDFAHHDALEDAKAAGQVLLAAQEVTGLSVEDWLERVEWTLDGQPRKHGGYGKPVKQDGNPDGPLYGEVIVFTGALMMPRHDAAARAAEAGCRVADAVSKKVTLLVVGDQDVTKLAEGQTRSTKHRKAEEFIAAGHPLRILRETDFVELVRLD